MNILFHDDKDSISYGDISTSDVFKRLGYEEPIQWIISSDKSQLFAKSGTGSRILLKDLNDPSAGKRTGVLPVPHLISSSVAQPSEECGQQVRNLEASLTSEDAEVRRASRQATSQLGPCIVKPLMSILAQNPSNYRIMLGVSVALVQMLRDNKDKRVSISGMLTDDDFKKLVGIAVHNDRTFRIYALEFLYDPGSPSSIDAILAAATEIERANFKNENGAFNLALIATNVSQNAKPEDRAKLVNFFSRWQRRVGAKTDEQIQKLQR
jgi:hypothetical protein